MSAPTRGAPSGRPHSSARLPNSSISPSSGVARPQTIFMTVDFPAPFLPTNP